jgi:hypothetical protein
MFKGHGYLRGEYLRVLEASVSIMPYPARPIITRARAIISDVAKYYTVTLSLDLGKDSNDPYLVP